MSLDERIRAARPMTPPDLGIDLDAASRDAVRSGRRRRHTYRVSAGIAIALSLALIGIPLVRSLVRDDVSRVTSTSRAGNRIVFSVREQKPLPQCDGSPRATITVMEPDGSGKTTLAEGDAPRWSPDGRRIAYARSRLDGAGGCDADVWMMDADGTDRQVVIAGSSPAWSPDGERIVFNTLPIVRSRDGEPRVVRNPQIWVTNADGSAATPATHPPEATADGWPDWSPDGRRIVFSRMHHDGRGKGDRMELWVVDLATGHEERLCCDGGQWPVAPTWSPDGSFLAFADGSLYAGRSTIVVVGADGSNPRRLSAGHYDGWPAWSSDGTRIAFTRIVDGAEQIFVMSVDGSDPRRLGSGSVPDFPPPLE